MKYTGPLYGKIGRKTFNTGRTSEDWDRMEDSLRIIHADVSAIRDEWLLRQPEGIQLIVANIRKHSTPTP